MSMTPSSLVRLPLPTCQLSGPLLTPALKPDSVTLHELVWEGATRHVLQYYVEFAMCCLTSPGEGGGQSS